MPDSSNINLWFGGLAVLIAAIVSAIVTLRLSRSTAKKSDLDDLTNGYAKLQATYLIENDRLNLRVDKLQNEKDVLLNKQTEDKAECLRQIVELQVSNAELQRQLTLLMVKMPDNTMTRKVEIVGAAIAVPVQMAPDNAPLSVKVENPLPVPVVIKGPLPVPMTAAQQAAADIAETESQKE